MESKLPAGTLERLWSDPSNWRGAVYSCKADPRLIVPKSRKALGWTLNIAHGSSWLLLVALILGATIPSLIFIALRMVGSLAWGAFLVGYIAIIYIGSSKLSSTKRF